MNESFKNCDLDLKKLPVDVGPSYEGERIRGPDMFLELGGPKIKFKFELVRVAGKDDIKDNGNFRLIGKDIPEYESGETIPFGIFIEVYGEKVEVELEGILERKIHDIINNIQGMMHLNQRYDIWCRISKADKEKGLKFEHIGIVIMSLLKKHFPFIERVQCTIITDEDSVMEFHKKAVEVYNTRDMKTRGMKDEDIDTFYGCTLCQSFAPGHICIISPERISLCGAISWLDARAAAKINPDGSNFPIPKGECLDPVKGIFTGSNAAIQKYSNNKIQQVALYTIFESVHTSCGCFESIGFYIPEVDGVGVVDRNFNGLSANGMKFSQLAAQAGGGQQIEGFLGIGIQWFYSGKFISADGGWNRMVWLPSTLKERIKDAIPPELFEKIPTEKDVKNIDELKNFLKEKNHPIVKRWEEAEKEEEEEIEIPDIFPDVPFPSVSYTKISFKDVRIEVESAVVKKGY
ncbi:MAG: CO dehydrogenase/CO-methylating acetyl-CoA synthase complex subunit beta [Candidatus Altiarchaeales archaeon HGW-Altiarchaeales-1]|nr:MAG: CO dehydrogenase/CO-methylating acetyl-CoA synthase complex subunit beta [Candidatus Altiarchaeales archaeon HGW-Altiarchaeales-1]